jgi:hypothetical protein
MDFLKQNKLAILIGVLLLAGLFVYMNFFTAPAQDPLTTTSSDTALSQDLLVTLQNLHTIKLDNSIFSDPAFKSLTDFGVTIPSEEVGRRNPFAPLQAGGAAGGSTINVPLLQTRQTR